MAARSAEVRRENRKSAKEAKERRAALVASQTPEAGAVYVARELRQVRQQIDRLNGMLDQEADPVRLDRLCSAITRLSERERQLAGRPLPGSLRPTKQKEIPPVWDLPDAPCDSG